MKQTFLMSHVYSQWLMSQYMYYKHKFCANERITFNSCLFVWLNNIFQFLNNSQMNIADRLLVSKVYVKILIWSIKKYDDTTNQMNYGLKDDSSLFNETLVWRLRAKQCVLYEWNSFMHIVSSLHSAHFSLISILNIINIFSVICNIT